jgi:cytosine/adenosine deaminase-related metal-dependent hydrolase
MFLKVDGDRGEASEYLSWRKQLRETSMAMQQLNRPTLISADWIYTASGLPIADGAVVVHNGYIIDVGERRNLETRHRYAVHHRHRNAVIIPGLVDCHAHLELTSFFIGREFTSLLQLMAAAGDFRRAAGETHIEAGCRRGQALSLQHGITCVLDWKSTDYAWYAGRDTPRMVFACEIVAPAPNCLDRVMERLKKISGAFPPNGPQYARLALAPHSLYMTCGRVWQEMLHTARRCSYPITSHVAESSFEMDWLSDQGQTLAEHCCARSQIARKARSYAGIVDVLSDRGHLHYPMILAHGVHLGFDELLVLARFGHALCICPSSNLMLHGRTVDLALVLQSGILMVLGTDSVRGQYDVLGEARVLLRQYSRKNRRLRSEVADRLLKACTINAAMVLKWSDRIGSIQTGRFADVIVLDCPPVKCVEDLALAVVTEAAITAVYLGGQLQQPLRHEHGSRHSQEGNSRWSADG